MRDSGQSATVVLVPLRIMVTCGVEMEADSDVVLATKKVLFVHNRAEGVSVALAVDSLEELEAAGEDQLLSAPDQPMPDDDHEPLVPSTEADDEFHERAVSEAEAISVAPEVISSEELAVADDHPVPVPSGDSEGDQEVEFQDEAVSDAEEVSEELVVASTDELDGEEPVPVAGLLVPVVSPVQDHEDAEADAAVAIDASSVQVVLAHGAGDPPVPVNVSETAPSESMVAAEAVASEPVVLFDQMPDDV
jgi:hypothetical protein